MADKAHSKEELEALFKQSGKKSKKDKQEPDASFVARAKAILGDDAMNERGMPEHAGPAEEPKGYHKRSSSGFESADAVAKRKKDEVATEKTMETLWSKDKGVAEAAIFGKAPSKSEAAAADAPAADAKGPTKKPGFHFNASDKPAAASEAPSSPAAIPPQNDTVDDDKLEKELLAAKDLYSRAKSQLEKREAIEAIANGLGKIGAGMYGNKMGTDMSGVKFDKQDWDKKRAAEAGDFQTSLADIGERRRQQVQNKQFDKKFNQDNEQFKTSMGQRDKEFGVTSGHSSAVLAETKRHNIAQEKLMGAGLVEKGKAAAAKLNGSSAAAFKKGVEETSSEIYSIGKDLEGERVDEKAAQERIQGLLTSKLGMSPEAARKLVVDGGFFSDSMHDPAAIQAGVNSLASTQVAVAQAKARVPAGSILVQNAEGQLGSWPEDVVDGAVKAGLKVIP
jgi:hypothetical protein